MAYAFQAALYCDPCGESRMHDLDEANQRDTGDTDDYPQYVADGGGESDSPSHCDDCNEFLENPLTDDGMAYVRRALAGSHSQSAIEPQPQKETRIMVTCKIQWITETGEPTPDTNPAIGYVQCEAYTEQYPAAKNGVIEYRETPWYPICAAHAARLPIAHWNFKPMAERGVCSCDVGPGKFEGESVETFLAWDAIGGGASDEDIGRYSFVKFPLTIDKDEVAAAKAYGYCDDCLIDAAENPAFGMVLWETDQGFVGSVIYDTEAAYDEARKQAEIEAADDCADE